jgi:indolepyruvate ferredoxin oxidoreductase beta subunit
MAQRGGAVLSHLRISDKNIAGDLVPKGGADLVISMEPLESLRYVEYLKTTGVLVTNSDPFVNIGNYPDIKTITAEIKKLPSFRLVEAGDLAKEAGHPKTVNTVMVGAASCFLPVKADPLKTTIADAFSKKDANVIEANKKAFDLGQTAAKK